MLKAVTKNHQYILIPTPEKRQVKTNIKYSDITKMKPDFLTSCFIYYEQKILKPKHKIEPTKLAPSFTKLKTNPILIVDYPNIIHILYDLEKENHKQNPKENLKTRLEHFFQTHSDHIIVLLCKKITIDNQDYSIQQLFNTSSNPPQHKNLHIYELDYENHISSSMDDLLGHFISFVGLMYYMQHQQTKNQNKNPKKHIQYITNDKQTFDKHLFGKTNQEAHQTLYLNKISYNPRTQIYDQVRDRINEKIVKTFLKTLMIFKTNQTKHLECNMKQFMRFISYPPSSSTSAQTYEEIDQIQHRYLTHTRNKTRKNCNTSRFTRKNHLIPSYYLYGMIKKTQTYLRGDLYGAFSREEIADFFALE